MMDGSRLALVLLLSGIGACTTPAPPPPTEPTVVVTPPVATEEPTAAAEPEPPPDTGPVPVTLLPDPACVIQGDWHTRKWQSPLLVRPDGPGFANVDGGAGRLHFPAGARPATQGLELEADGIAVSGYIDSDASDLRPAEAFWLNGLALPTPSTPLLWTAATPGNLAVTVEAPAGLELLAPPLSATVACKSVATQRVAFQPESRIDGFKKAKPRQLVTGRAVDIALEPGGAVVARAQPDKWQIVDVSLLEVRGAMSRIDWEVGSLHVVGWVKSADIHVPKNGFGYGGGSGRLGSARYAGEYVKRVCSEDVPLVAAIFGKRFLVGRIRAGTVIEETSTHDDATRVRVRTQRILPANNVDWEVATSALRDCQSSAP